MWDIHFHPIACRSDEGSSSGGQYLVLQSCCDRNEPNLLIICLSWWWCCRAFSMAHHESLWMSWQQRTDSRSATFYYLSVHLSIEYWYDIFVVEVKRQDVKKQFCHLWGHSQSKLHPFWQDDILYLPSFLTIRHFVPTSQHQAFISNTYGVDHKASVRPMRHFILSKDISPNEVITSMETTWHQ